jgi:hypothetical protein
MRALAFIILVAAFSAQADSTILKGQALALNMDTSKLALTSTMGKNSLLLTCDNVRRFDLKRNIEKLDINSFSPRGIFGKEKKIKQVKQLKSDMITKVTLIEEDCELFSQDIDNNDLRLIQVNRFRSLLTLTQNFMDLIINSK